VSPQGLLQVYREVQGCEPPPSTLLAIRGECFELGAAPSASALAGLDAAVAWALCWLAQRLCQVNAGRDAMSEDGG
jgi:hypothetical protein